MNERLTQLAKQAQVEHCISHVRLQEFAELIIKECDQYARSTWEHGHLLGGDLKRLFGMEE